MASQLAKGGKSADSLAELQECIATVTSRELKQPWLDKSELRERAGQLESRAAA